MTHNIVPLYALRQEIRYCSLSPLHCAIQISCPFEMALRISAKRVAATLKASNMSSSTNGLLKRNASQATAAKTNLSEGVRDDIYVSSTSHLIQRRQLTEEMFRREKHNSPILIHQQTPQPQPSSTNKHPTW